MPTSLSDGKFPFPEWSAWNVFLSTFPLLLLLQEPTPAWTFLRKISLSPNLDEESPCSALAIPYTYCHGSTQSARSHYLLSVCLTRLQQGRQRVFLMVGCLRLLTTWLLQPDKWHRRTGGIITEGPNLVISQVIGRPLKDKYRQKAQRNRRKRRAFQGLRI